MVNSPHFQAILDIPVILGFVIIQLTRYRVPGLIEDCRVKSATWLARPLPDTSILKRVVWYFEEGVVF